MEEPTIKVYSLYNLNLIVSSEGLRFTTDFNHAKAIFVSLSESKGFLLQAYKHQNLDDRM